MARSRNATIHLCKPRVLRNFGSFVRSYIKCQIYISKSKERAVGGELYNQQQGKCGNILRNSELQFCHASQIIREVQALEPRCVSEEFWSKTHTTTLPPSSVLEYVPDCVSCGQCLQRHVPSLYVKAQDSLLKHSLQVAWFSQALCFLLVTVTLKCICGATETKLKTYHNIVNITVCLNTWIL